MRSGEQVAAETASQKAEQAFANQFFIEQKNCTGERKCFSKEKGLLGFPYLRRLDSFAILFEYLVNCTGVALVGKQVIFAANKLTFSGEKFNKDILNDIVKQTMNYFSALANQQSNLKEMREKTFRRLCSYQRIFSIKKPDMRRDRGEELKVNIKPEEVERMVGEVVNGNALSMDELMQGTDHEPDKAIIASTALKLNKHFTRIERFINKIAESGHSSSQREQNLFEAIRDNNLFFLPEPEQNVHVELQLAGYALTQVNQFSIVNDFFYLGLSKLCCKDCNAMLFAISDVLLEKGVNIKFVTRGWNNIQQPWEDPFLYWNNVKFNTVDWITQMKISYANKNKMITPSKNVDITGDLSDSETSSVHGIGMTFGIIKDKQIEKLQQAKEILSAGCLYPLGEEVTAILARIAFVEFLFNSNNGWLNYYNNNIDIRIEDCELFDDVDENEKYFSHKSDLLMTLNECKKNGELLYKLEKSKFYDYASGAFYYDFLEKTLQDKVFVGAEIAEHFESNAEIFDNLGTIITKQPVVAVNITAWQQGCEETGLSSKAPLIFSAPVEGVHLSTIQVNNNYLYEDNDITAILFARLLEARELQFLVNQDTMQVLAAVDGMNPGQLERQLKANRDANPGKSLLLIPYNLGRNHWIGLLLEFNNDNELVRAEYMNSLGRGNFDELQKRLQTLYPICSLVERQLFKQEDLTSCGAYTIENLLLAAQGSDVPQPRPSSSDIRRKHLECLKKFRPDFHEVFYDRQRYNISTVLSLNSQLGYSDRDEKRFTVLELKKILDICQYINQISSLDLQIQLWKAFKSNIDEQDNINLHYTRIRNIIKNIATKLNDNVEDQKCFKNLVQTLFNVGWQMGTNLDIDNADFWITYEQIEAIAKRQDVNVNYSDQTKINDDISTQIKKDEELALQLQKQIDEEYRKTKFSVSIN